MKFKDYEIVKALGPSVYLINQKPLDRLAVLKVLEPPYADETISRFEREARLCSQLKTDGVVKIFDSGNWRSRYYFVSEFVEGLDLGKRLAERGRFPFPVARFVMLELAKTLAAVHNQGIIHRDLKPSNIIIADDGAVKITDFGLARSLTLPAITIEGSIIGTPGYMSPEQVTAQPLDPRTDIFSLGVVFYELLTGTNPFAGKSYSEIINNITKIKPEPIPDLPSPLWKMLKKMLEKIPSRRYQNLQPVIETLGKIDSPIGRTEFVAFLKTGSTDQPAATLLRPPQKKLRALYLLILLPGLVYMAVRLVPRHARSQPAQRPDNTTTPVPVVPQPATTPTENPKPVTNTRDGYLKINVIPWAEVYVDGKFIDRTPIGQPLRLAAGFHRLKLVYEGLPVYEQNLEIKAARPSELALDLKDYTASLNVQVVPWGKIAVDGVDKGVTPLAPIVVPKGRHKITVSNPDYPAKEETIDFRAREVVSKTFRFP